MRAVIDEDLPRSFGYTLKSLGFEVFDIRDHDLRGRSDSEIFSFAQKQKAVLFSADLGFANIVHFPLHSHHGIVVLRFPNDMPTPLINDTAHLLLARVSEDDYGGNLIILTPHSARIRRTG